MPTRQWVLEDDRLSIYEVVLEFKLKCFSLQSDSKIWQANSSHLNFEIWTYQKFSLLSKIPGPRLKESTPSSENGLTVPTVYCISRYQPGRWEECQLKDFKQIFSFTSNRRNSLEGDLALTLPKFRKSRCSEQPVNLRGPHARLLFTDTSLSMRFAFCQTSICDDSLVLGKFPSNRSLMHGLVENFRLEVRWSAVLVSWFIL